MAASESKRRVVMGMALAFPAAAAAASQTIPAGDAKLIAMCSEYLANEVEYERIEEPYWHQPGPCARPSPADEATLAALIERNRELYDLIADTRATSDEGRRAVARVCRCLLTFDPEGNLHDDTDAVLLTLLDSVIGEARA